MKRAITMSLHSVRNLGQICALERDHFDLGDWSILTDGYAVWISKQKSGQYPTDKIQVPKHIFDKLIDRYLKPQRIGKWEGDKFKRELTKGDGE